MQSSMGILNLKIRYHLDVESWGVYISGSVNFVYLKVSLDLEKTNQLGESSPNFIFVAVNLDPNVLEKSILWYSWSPEKP